MFKVLTEECEPTRGTKYSACVDLYSIEDVAIGIGETKVVGLGVAINEEELEKIIYENRGKFGLDYHTSFLNTHYLQVALRSSLGKEGLIMPNGVGIIDMDYRDEIKIIIHNPYKLDPTAYREMDRDKADEVFRVKNTFTINKGQRIAQVTLLEHKSELFCINSDVVRDGGFGSTGSN